MSHRRDFFFSKSAITRLLWQYLQTDSAHELVTRKTMYVCARVCILLTKLKRTPPIEDHFSRSFDESFIRHVVTSVNYPPPSPPPVSNHEAASLEGIQYRAGYIT